MRSSLNQLSQEFEEQPVPFLYCPMYKVSIKAMTVLCLSNSFFFPSMLTFS